MPDISNFTGLEIIMCIMLLCILAISIALFVKEAKYKKFSIKEPNIEYAPMYSKPEKIKKIAKILAVVVPAYLFLELWFFPKMGEYAANSNCHIYWGFTGDHVVLYGVFVGLPLLYASFLVPMALKAVKMYKLEQYPLPDEKVMQLTRYQYGIYAKARAIGILLSVILFCLVAAWGVGAANKILQNAQPCAANKSLKGTAPTGAASQYCAGCVRFALRAPLSPLALRYTPTRKLVV